MLDTLPITCRGQSVDVPTGSVWTEVFGFGKWVLGGLFGLVIWFIKADRDLLVSRQIQQGERIAAIEESRPSRSEVTEMFTAIRVEIRSDITDLKERIDMLIDMHRDMRR